MSSFTNIQLALPWLDGCTFEVNYHLPLPFNSFNLKPFSYQKFESHEDINIGTADVRMGGGSYLGRCFKGENDHT